MLYHTVSLVVVQDPLRQLSWKHYTGCKHMVSKHLVNNVWCNLRLETINGEELVNLVLNALSYGIYMSSYICQSTFSERFRWFLMLRLLGVLGGIFWSSGFCNWLLCQLWRFDPCIGVNIYGKWTLLNLGVWCVL